MNKTLERLARRIVPSTSLLSYNPVFRIVADLSDWPAKLFWPEYRRLPPNHLRIRVGVGNRFFSNQIQYLSGSALWFYYLSTGAVKLDSTIVDIGCGCGRSAHHLRDFRFQNARFSGKYIGIDIDEEALNWCRSHFDTPRFTFLHSTHYNKSYAQAGQGTGNSYGIPVPDGTADFVFSRSLFTHLLEPELRNYLEESHRVLKTGAEISMSFFCLDYPPPTYGGRHTFSQRKGNAAVESLEVPEAAVAYSEAFIVNLAYEVGFRDARVIGGDPAAWQSILSARKAS